MVVGVTEGDAGGVDVGVTDSDGCGVGVGA